jgi:hypothetical protein
MTHRQHLALVLSPVAAALLMALPATGFAQSNADLLKELQALKARITQLESAQSAAPAAGGVDPTEFNRVKVKVEALEDGQESAGFKGLKINGWMDPTYMYSSSRKAGGFNFLNGFSGVASQNKPEGYSFDNSFFGMAMLDFQKEMEGGTKWRLTLAPHKAASSAYNVGSIVHEASVSVPLGDLQTRFIAGQIPDWSGYEYIPSTQNKLITHNILFDFTMPNYYTGAGMELVRGKWTMKGLIGEMNSNRRAAADKSDKSPIITYRADYSNNEYSGFGFAGQHGKSYNAKVNMLEVDAYYTRGDFSLFGQLSTGNLANAALDGTKAKWSGASVLAGYKLTPKLELLARADLIKNKKSGVVFGSTSGGNEINGFGESQEYVDDGSGTNTYIWQGTGMGVNRTALSLGLNYLHTSNVSFKAEVRQDRASGATFLQQGGSYKKSNTIFGLSTVVSF